MGDIWPYGPPKHVTWDDAFAQLRTEGMGAGDANIGAAIGMAESRLDLRVINDTPATGDYSVGAWQINYFGSLYAGRVSQFGTPKQLIDHGLIGQAHACYTLWIDSGFSPWSTFRNGAYKAFLNGKYPVGGGPAPPTSSYPNPQINPPKEDYSATVRAGGVSIDNLGRKFSNGAHALKLLRR